MGNGVYAWRGHLAVSTLQLLSWTLWRVHGHSVREAKLGGLPWLEASLNYRVPGQPGLSPNDFKETRLWSLADTPQSVSFVPWVRSGFKRSWAFILLPFFLKRIWKIIRLFKPFDLFRFFIISLTNGKLINFLYISILSLFIYVCMFVCVCLCLCAPEARRRHQGPPLLSICSFEARSLPESGTCIISSRLEPENPSNPSSLFPTELQLQVWGMPGVGCKLGPRFHV